MSKKRSLVPVLWLPLSLLAVSCSSVKVDLTGAGHPVVLNANPFLGRTSDPPRPRIVGAYKDEGCDTLAGGGGGHYEYSGDTAYHVTESYSGRESRDIGWEKADEACGYGTNPAIINLKVHAFSYGTNFLFVAWSTCKVNVEGTVVEYP